MTHDKQIPRTAVAIYYPVLKQGFNLEAESLKCGARAGLIGSHHRGHLLDAAGLTQRENFGGEAAAEPCSAMSRSDLHANLTHSPRPPSLI